MSRSYADHVPIGTAAEMLGVSVDTLRRWEKNGRITAQRTDGGHRVFDKSAIEALKNRRGVSITEAASELGVSASTLRRYEKDGVVTPGRNDRGERSYSHSDIDTVKAHREQKPTPPASKPASLAPEPTVIVDPWQSQQNKYLHQESAEEVAKKESPSPVSSQIKPQQRPKQPKKGLPTLLKPALAFVLLLLALFQLADVISFRPSSNEEAPGGYLAGIYETFPGKTVLAAISERPQEFIEINVPAYFQGGTFQDDVLVSGNITANNLVYSVQGVNGDVELTGSDGIIVTGTNFSLEESALTLGGDLSGSLNEATINPDSVALGTDTVGNYITSISASSSDVTITTSGSESISATIGFTPGGVSYTWPTDDGDSDQVLTSDGSGTLTWEDPTSAYTFKASDGSSSSTIDKNETLTVAGGTGITTSISGNTITVASSSSGTMSSFTLSGDSGTDQTIEDAGTVTIAGGNALTSTTSATDTLTLNIDILDSADGTGATSSQSGFELAGSGSDELALLQGCSANQILKWDDTNNIWECAADSSGGGGYTWTLSDGSTTQTISDTDTVTVTGGTNITATVSATDTVTLNVDDAFVLNSGDTMTGELVIYNTSSSSSTTEGALYYDTDNDNLYVYANGAFVDLTQQDTDTDTTYTAGNDLDLSGTEFSLESTLDIVATINLAGTGTINGLDAIDETSELTLESTLDLAGDITGSLNNNSIVANAVEESHLKAVDTASDEECLTYETTTGDFEWQSCGTFSSFTLSGDSGSETISDGNTLQATGGTGITTAVTATDTLTINITDDSLDFTELEDTLDLDASTSIALNTYTLSLTDSNTFATFTDGVVNFNNGGNTTELMIPTSTGFAFSNSGAIGIDTDGNSTEVNHGVIDFYDGTNTVYLFGSTSYPSTDGHVLTFDSGTNAIVWEAASGGTPNFDEVYEESANVDADVNMEIDSSSGLTFDITSTGNFSIDHDSSLTPFAVFADGGTIDFGAANSFEIPSGTSVTVDAAGEIAIDTDADGDYIDQGWLTYYDGTQQMYVPAFDSIGTPSDNDVLSYDATNDKWVIEAQAGGGGTPNFDEVYAQSITDGNLVMEVDNSSGLTYNLNTTGNFTIQHDGTTFANFEDGAIIDFNNGGNTTELMIPTSTGFAFSNSGAIGIDTDGNSTEVNHGVIDFYDGTNTVYLFGSTSYPSTDGHVLTFDSGTNAIVWEAASGGTPNFDEVYEESANVDADVNMEIDSSSGLTFDITSTGNFSIDHDSSLTPFAVFADGGTIDFGAANSFEIPNSATPTVNTTGQIAFDTTVTDFSTGLIRAFNAGEEQGIISLPIGEFSSPTDNHIIAYNASTDEFELVAESGTGTMSSFTLSGDSGSETISDGNTLTVTTDGHLTSAVTATDTVTISLDDDTIDGTELADAITLDATLAFDDGTNTFLRLIDEGTTAALDLTGDFTATGDITISGDDLFMATNTDTAILVADGTNFNPVVPSGDVSLTNAGVFSITANAVDLTADVTGTLPVSNGGTGTTSLTDGGILLGSGTGAITAMAVLADGAIVIGDGSTDPVAQTVFTSSTGDLLHEAGGLEADVSSYTGLIAISGGSTSEVDAKSELEAQIADVSDFAEADGDTFTGTHDFGGATSLEIPNSATPTVNTTGQIAFDTTVTDFSTGLMRAFNAGEEQGIISLPIGEFSSPTDNHIIAYNASTDEFELVAESGTGTMSSFTLSGDSGSETISDGNTLTLTGGTGITTAVAATDTVTFSFDCSEVEGTDIDCSGENITLETTLDSVTDINGLSSISLTNASTLDFDDGTNTFLTLTDAGNTVNLDLTGNLAVTGTPTLSGLATGTDNTVLVLNSSNQIVTDEIDPDVWTPGTLLDGSGAANRVAYFSDSDTLTYDDNFFFDGTNVGINTTSPSATLDVSGSLTVRSLDCTGNLNGGALTADASGVISCTDDDDSGGSSLWTDGGAVTYLTSETDDLALGGTGSSAPLFFDEGNELLTLTNTTAGDSFRVNDESSDTSPFIIDADGQVGIGTDNPSSELHLASSTASDAVTLFIKHNDTTSSTSHANLNISTGNANGGNPYVTFNVNVAETYTMGIDNTDNDNFKISDSSALGTNDRLIINSSGYIGIGDTSPDDLLNIHGAASEAALALTSTGTNTDVLIKYELTDGTPAFVMGVDDSDSDYFKIDYGTTLGGNNAFVINSSGQIGINTSSPSATLDVSGTAIFNDEGTDSDFRIEGDSEANLFFVDASADEIGIGTASPDEELDISGQVQIAASSGTANPSGSRLYIEHGASQEGINITSTSGSAFAPLNIFNSSATNIFKVQEETGLTHIGNTGGGLDQQLYITPSSGSTDALEIEAHSSQAATLLQITSNGGTDGDLLTIDATGNVGIGTTSPAATLDVSGSLTVRSLDCTGNLNGGALTADASGVISCTDDDDSGGGGSWTISDDDTDTYTISDSDTLRFTSSSGDIATNLLNGDDTDENLDLDIVDDSLDFTELEDTLDLDAALAINTSANNITINEDGADSDFRIEGDTETNLLFVDASTDRVGIGTNGPLFTLDVDSADPTPFSIQRTGSSANVSMALQNDDDIMYIGMDSNEAFAINDGPNLGDTPAFTVDMLNANTVVIDSAGQLGIGISSPSVTLDVSGGAVFNQAGISNQDFRIEGDTDANLFFTDASTNYVGIGTNTPGTNLDVDGSIEWNGTIFHAGGQLTMAASAIYYSNTNGAHVNFAGGQSLRFESGTSADANNYAFQFDAEDDISAANGVFSIEEDGVSRMFIDGAGEVGIATSSPSATLDVSGSLTVRSLDCTGNLNGGALTADASGVISCTDDDDSGGSSLWTDGGAVTYLTSETDDLALGGTGSSAPLFFDEGNELLTLTNTTAGDSFRVNDESSDTSPFIIDADGKVGVGDATPNALLNIQGTTEQLRLDYSDSKYASFTVDTNNDLEISTDGFADAIFIDDSRDEVLIGSDGGYTYESTPNPSLVIATEESTAQEYQIQVQSVDSNSAGQTGDYAGIAFALEGAGLSSGVLGQAAAIKAETESFVGGSRARAVLAFEVLSSDGTSLEEKMRISQGNLGIGTSSPQATLDVSGDAIFNDAGVNHDFRIEGASEANLFFVDASADKIGIGTASPSAELTVDSAAANTTTLMLRNDLGSTVFQAGTDSSSNPVLTLTDETPGVNIFHVENTKAYVHGNVDFGFGDTTPDEEVDIENTSVDSDLLRLEDSDGACEHNPESGSETVTCSSDARLKENIRDSVGALAYLNNLRIREYEVIASGNTVTGLVAQEALGYAPELVTQGEDGIYMVSQISEWKIISAIQELSDLMPESGAFEEVEAQITALNARVTTLENIEPTTTPVALSTTGDLDVTTFTLPEEINQDIVITGSIDIGTQAVIREDLTVYGTLIADTVEIANALNVHGDTTIFGNLDVAGNITAEGNIYLNKQQAGFGSVKAGETEVRIEFEENAYEGRPVVTLSPRGLNPVTWGIVDDSNEGFTVKISEELDHDFSFTWTAWPVNNLEEEATEAASTTPSTSPSASPIPSPETTPESDAESISTPEPTSSPSPAPSPSPEPTPEIDASVLDDLINSDSEGIPSPLQEEGAESSSEADEVNIESGVVNGEPEISISPEASPEPETSSESEESIDATTLDDLINADLDEPAV